MSFIDSFYLFYTACKTLRLSVFNKELLTYTYLLTWNSWWKGKLQNSAVLLSSSAKHRNHITPIIRTLNWFSALQRVTFKIAAMRCAPAVS